MGFALLNETVNTGLGSEKALFEALLALFDSLIITIRMFCLTMAEWRR